MSYARTNPPHRTRPQRAPFGQSGANPYTNASGNPDGSPSADLYGNPSGSTNPNSNGASNSHPTTHTSTAESRELRQ